MNIESDYFGLEVTSRYINNEMKYNNTSLFLSIVTLLFSFSFESVYGIFIGDRVRAILELKDHLIIHFLRVFTLVFMR